MNLFSDLYSSDSEDDSVFDEMLGNDKTNPIKYSSSYIISPLVVANHTPPKVSKKLRKTLCWHQLDSIIWTESVTVSLSQLISTALHSVSQAIIRDPTDKVALYNRAEEACCANSGASE